MSENASRATAAPARPAVPSAPSRRSIASFRNYADAERAVDGLADRGFPVERVAIVGRDLKSSSRSPVGWTTPAPHCAVRSAAPSPAP